jgi:hypothetical protein
LASDPQEISPPEGEEANGHQAGSADPAPPAHPSFTVGDAVQLATVPRYLKSADPMPMLRPPDLVDPGETGRVSEIRPLAMLAVRFRRGTFLIAAADLRPVTPAG